MGTMDRDYTKRDKNGNLTILSKTKNNVSGKLERETLDHQRDSNQSKPAEKLLTPEDKMQIAQNIMARTKFAVEGFESNTKVEYINTRFNEYNYREDEGQYSKNETSMEISMWCKIGLHKYGKPQFDSSKTTSLEKSHFKICKRCGKHVSCMKSTKG